jgi:hypothetical protein
VGGGRRLELPCEVSAALASATTAEGTQRGSRPVALGVNQRQGQRDSVSVRDDDDGHQDHRHVGAQQPRASSSGLPSGASFCDLGCALGSRSFLVADMPLVRRSSHLLRGLLSRAGAPFEQAPERHELHALGEQLRALSGWNLLWSVAERARHEAALRFRVQGRATAWTFERLGSFPLGGRDLGGAPPRVRP